MIDLPFKRLHINTAVIRGNAKHDFNDPPITVRYYSSGERKTARLVKRCHEAIVHGPSRFLYNKDGTAMPCGARVWVETEAEVELIGEQDGSESYGVRKWGEPEEGS